MAHTEPVILTNMCMITAGDSVLVQDRLNPDWPGVTFPGGHVEPQESFVRSVIREVKEETGLDIANVRLCGIKQFTHSSGDYRYIVLLYKTSDFSGELRSSSEGKVFWIKRSELEQYTLPDGFAEMLEVFENNTLSENYHWFDSEWHEENL